ncbi:hypothetical protein [Nostoc sp. NMS4]|nr:hypothetical protein [Nostoc sp. NMS4]
MTISAIFYLFAFTYDCICDRSAFFGLKIAIAIRQNRTQIGNTE